MINFYFDFLSPYSYLAFMRIDSFKKETDSVFFETEWKLRPVFLPQVIKRFQKEGPGDIAVKREYMLKDCALRCVKESLPFQIPSILPFNSSLPLRLVTLFEDDEQWNLVRDLFLMAWGKGQDIGDENELGLIMAHRGHNLEYLQEGLRKARLTLKENHEQAAQRNIFGLPTFDYLLGAKKEIFWGNDSLFLLKDQLEEDRERYF